MASMVSGLGLRELDMADPLDAKWTGRPVKWLRHHGAGAACCFSRASGQLRAGVADDSACKEPPLLMRASETMPFWECD
jgi:hypothetical protein